MNLMRRRTQEPFRSCIDPPRTPLRGENLLLGIVMCVLIVAVLCYIAGASR